MDRYQRQSREFKQTLSIELIHKKNFKEVALRFGTSPTTVMRRFDEIGATHLKETKELPRIIVIDEYKGDTAGEIYQTVIADSVNRKPLDILPDRKKETVKKYLKQHEGKVEVVRYVYWTLEQLECLSRKTSVTMTAKSATAMKN